MTIQERINKIKDYFIGMNVAENIVYVSVKFPNKWAVSELTEPNFKTNIAPMSNGAGIYFYTELLNGFDVVFDAIEYNINFNQQAEERIALLKQKIDELREIFDREDIETLKTIEFKYKVPKKKNVSKNGNNRGKKNLDQSKENIEKNDNIEAVAEKVEIVEEKKDEKDTSK